MYNVLDKSRRRVGNIDEQKIIIPISKCTPGMIILQPIIDKDTGNVLVGGHQSLSEEVIGRIGKFKHTEIWIKADAEKQLWQVDEKVKVSYKKYITLLREIIGNKGPVLDIQIEEVENLAKCIVEEFECKFDLLACVNLVKKIDKDIYTHSMNVTFLALFIGRWIGCHTGLLKNIALAGLLHDIGKMEAEVKIANGAKKKSAIIQRLEEKRHPIYGYEKLLAFSELDNEVLGAVLAHHERCDGSGYPLHLTQERIGAIGKIIGLADEYEFLRKDKHIFEVVRVLKNEKVRQFDKTMLLTFCTNVINYYIGASVLLSTDEIAQVAFIQSHALHRPIVKIGERYINLYKETQIDILKVF